MIKNFDNWLSESKLDISLIEAMVKEAHDNPEIAPTKLEIAMFDSIIDEACKAVDELWTTGKYSSVVFRCGWLDYSYLEFSKEYDNNATSRGFLLSGQVKHPDNRYKEDKRLDAINRFVHFVLQGTGKDNWGQDATLMLFRVTEVIPNTIRKNFTYHYRFEYDWNPDTSSIELVQDRSGQQVDHGKMQLNQESGKIAGVISEHIAKKYKFQRTINKKFGL